MFAVSVVSMQEMMGNCLTYRTTELNKTEILNKVTRIHPKDNHIRLDLSETEGNAIVSVYVDGYRTENHVGSSMVAMKTLTEIHIATQRLNIACMVFQVELCGINMAVDWIQSQRNKIPLLRHQRRLQSCTACHRK
jgi:hypothetical protein